MKALICDIDGTLADCRHRLHHVLPGGPRDWDAFFAAMHLDGCIEPVRDLVSAAHSRFAVVLSSGRPESHRAVTEDWLRAQGVAYSALYMRPPDDTRADHIVKREMLDRIRADGYAPFAVIDDRPSVVAMWRDAGLICLQVAPGDLPIPASAALTLMVGPSGGGKSRWLTSDEARREYGIRPSHIIASDEVRADMCGDFRDQSRNQDVFAAVHAMALARLRAGLATVVDATHLRRKDRMSAAAMVPAANAVRYIVIDRPLRIKRQDAGWRAELVGVDLIGKHAQTFASQIKDILRGDGLPNVTVYDLRSALPERAP